MNIARKMKKNGVGNEIISKSTGSTKEQTNIL